MKINLIVLVFLVSSLASFAQTNITDWRAVAAETNNPMSLRLNCAKLISISTNKVNSDNSLILSVVQDAADSGIKVLTDNELTSVMDSLILNKPTGYYKIALNAVKNQNTISKYRGIAAKILIDNPNRTANDIDAVTKLVESGVLLPNRYSYIISFVASNSPDSYNKMQLNAIKNENIPMYIRQQGARRLSEIEGYSTNASVVKFLDDSESVLAKKHAERVDIADERMSDIRFKRALQSKLFIERFSVDARLVDTSFVTNQALIKSYLDAGNKEAAKQVLKDCRELDKELMNSCVLNFFTARRYQQQQM